MAAECEYRGKPAIVVCADWRGQTGDITQPDSMIGSEDTGKIRDIRGATVLLSGKHGKAVELSAACKNVIRDFTQTQIDQDDLDIAITNFMGKLRRVAAERRTDLIHRFVLNSTGLTHAEFVKLPTDQYLEVWHGIRQLNLEADLLITLVSHEAIIIRLDRWGECHWESNYGVIGNGAEIARAMLCLQPWSPANLHNMGGEVRASLPPIEECLFRLHEAHFAANKANPSSVGEVISFGILRGKYRAAVSPEFLLHLTKQLYLKHCVPRIAQIRDANKLLHRCQSFTTGHDIPEPIDDSEDV
jgi:hypothetical protein